jgi:hypothetical protein
MTGRRNRPAQPHGSGAPRMRLPRAGVRGLAKLGQPAVRAKRRGDAYSAGVSAAPEAARARDRGVTKRRLTAVPLLRRAPTSPAPTCGNSRKTAEFQSLEDDTCEPRPASRRSPSACGERFLRCDASRRPAHLRAGTEPFPGALYHGISAKLLAFWNRPNPSRSRERCEPCHDPSSCLLSRSACCRP